MLFVVNPEEPDLWNGLASVRSSQAESDRRRKERNTTMQFSKRVSSRTTERNRRSLPGWLVRSLVITLVTWFGGPAPSAAQGTINTVASHPAIVYVTNTDGGVTEINARNDSVIATAPFRGVGAAAAVTPDGRRIYVTDYLSANVVVLDAAKNVPLTQVPVGSGMGNIGVAVTPDGSAVYVTSQFDGIVTVIATATNTVVKTIPTGAGPIWVTISPDGARAYVSNAGSGTVSVIATASNSVIATVSGIACPYHTRLIHFESELLVSSQCDNTLKVVSTATNTIVKSIPTGPTPRGIAVTPGGTRAYVADFGGNTVDVIDLTALTNLGTPITVGLNPRGLALAPGGHLYVANSGESTVSVIDTANNQVSATLNARGGPVEVTVSTTARPRVLNYSFQSLEPPGSLNSVATAINNHGLIVGRFTDVGGTSHGYLRKLDGSFVTIDPPGSIHTFGPSINDDGAIAGNWTAADGTLHGFTRSAAGVYATLDFPGAVDTAPFGLNSQGTIVGAYDLGDQTTAIGFELRRGVFTSFEDPAAVPMLTQANDINSQNLIVGLYGDAAGNLHGFTRHPDGRFQNFDFPGADNTLPWKINNLGQVVGGYFTNFPQHGFVLTDAADLVGPASPSHFFSFDYPNSQATSGVGINNDGQIVGFYVLRGSPGRHGFLATRTADEDD
jgi:YVTN family beta-propeller protein